MTTDGQPGAPLPNDPGTAPVPDGSTPESPSRDTQLLTKVEINGATQAGGETQLFSTRVIDTPPCPTCQSARSVVDRFCNECGYIFPDVPEVGPTDDALIRERYRLGERIGACGNVERFAALDLHARGSVPVIILREEVNSADNEPEVPQRPPRYGDSTDVLFLPELAGQPLESAGGHHTMPLKNLPQLAWPGVEWERIVLERAEHLSLPRVLDHFQENGFIYLVEESPPGRPLWEAWRDAAVPQTMRYGWLTQLAEALHALHEAGAIIAGLRPEMISITPTGQAVIADLRDLLPMPVPADAQVPATFYTAPELLFRPESADPRSDLYGFGGILYALSLGRDLTEADFRSDGLPKPFLERFPDAHPLFGRLVSKTFNPDVELRFPADPNDGTAGIGELIHALDACMRNAARVRLDVAGWTTTGMVRSGNEDALAIHHSAEGRLEEGDEYALLVLADGMGGVESGEVAAAIAVQSVRKFLMAEPPFAGMAQGPTTTLRGPASEKMLSAVADEVAAGSEGSSTMDVPSPLVWPGSLMLDSSSPSSPLRGGEAHQERVGGAIREANRQVHQAAKHGLGDRGMGCTLEVVVIDGSTAVFGHVGDSRAYHLSAGRLVQVTRDQTLVNRLMELGQLTPEQADTHPRRSELQQAVGGRPDVFPDVHVRNLQPGDWLLVCSDGLTGQLRQEVIQEIMEGSPSAERAARRLVNRANLQGAVDNVSVVVVRAL